MNRVLLFAITRDSLEELQELLKTAGGASLGAVVSRKASVDPDYYFAKGKLEELKRSAQKLQPDFLLANDPLSPRQERNIENYTGFPVVDRTALILDIFALHAKSAEGKLQVEIAQIEYNLTRMRGLWPHLARLGAGIGTRGPGESQIETDRRLARKRLALLKKRLGKINASRERNRKERLTSGVPRLALFGYTNAGKSSIQNLLCHSGQKTDNTLFHTLDSKTSAYVFCDNRYLVSDTVGLIDKLPHGLIAAFRGTLAEASESDLLLHVSDARKAVREIAVSHKILKDLDIEDKPRLLLLNKSDLLTDREKDILKERYPKALLISTRDAACEAIIKARVSFEITRGMEPLSLQLTKDYLPYRLRQLAFERKGAEASSEIFTPKTKSYLFQKYL